MFFAEDPHMIPYSSRPLVFDGRWKPNVELAPNCPRCDSSNTKFCYYNNYSLTQPRYFCKGCRRYWTKGGSLRNVPMGGGYRKNLRGKSARMSSNSMSSGSICRHGRPLSSLRPDLALDGMVGNSYHSNSSNSASLIDISDSRGGQAIDLAQLYNKYLNQCPVLETGDPVPAFDKPFGLISPPGFANKLPTDILSQSSSELMPETLMTDSSQASIGELSSSMDQMRYESLAAFSTDGMFTDLLSPNCSIVSGNLMRQAPNYQELSKAAIDGIDLHQNDDGIGDWSMLEHSSFDDYYTL